MKNQKLGKAGEDKATFHLENLGYKILKRNFRVKEGEIDIVASKEKTILFAEVKTRNSSSYGSANLSFPWWRVKRLFSASLVFIAEFEEFTEFDREFFLITIDGNKLKMIQLEMEE